LISKLYNSDTRLTLCHNDLTKPNILVGDTISFIDWEYASLNDPHYDIATIFQAFNLNANQRDTFLIGYNSANINLARVSQFIALTKLTDRLWGRAIDTFT
jgi:thiamine kinase-like enzyme